MGLDYAAKGPEKGGTEPVWVILLIGIDPADVAVLALVDYIQPFGLGITEQEETVVRSRYFGGRFINTERLDSCSVRTDDF